jgi:hypothetical protein
MTPNLRDAIVATVQRPVEFAVDVVGRNLVEPVRVYALAYLGVECDIGIVVYDAVSERL